MREAHSIVAFLNCMKPQLLRVEIPHLIEFRGHHSGIKRRGPRTKVNNPGTSPEALQKQRPLVRGAHASRVSAWASRPSHPNRSRRDAERSTRDACAPRTNTNQAEASFGE